MPFVTRCTAQDEVIHLTWPELKLLLLGGYDHAKYWIPSGKVYDPIGLIVLRADAPIDAVCQRLESRRGSEYHCITRANNLVVPLTRDVAFADWIPFAREAAGYLGLPSAKHIHSPSDRLPTRLRYADRAVEKPADSAS